MDVALRPDLEKLVLAKVNAGAWHSSDDLVNEAVEKLLVYGDRHGSSDPWSAELADDMASNLRWIEKNGSSYRDQWVALHKGRLVAHGTDPIEVHRAATSKGISLPLMHQMIAQGPAFWGGW